MVIMSLSGKRIPKVAVSSRPLLALHCLFSSCKLKIAQVNEINQGQTEKHCPVAYERDDGAHDHWAKGMSQI
jgi:hypothetical protein